MGKNTFAWPFMDLAVQGADPDPSVTELEIIGAGLPRTGTASLQHALVILGFGPCHHGATLYRNPERTIMFAKAVKGQDKDFRKLMAGFRATTDGPACHLVPELLEAFPKAKVILTVRDTPMAWGLSMKDTLARFGPYLIFCTLPIRYLRLHTLMSLAVLKHRWYPIYGKEKGLQIYTIHNDWIRDIVPKEQLLEFNVKEGWEPLCKFLNVPVPDMPFPKTNEQTALKRDVDTAIMMGLAAWVGIFLTMGVTGYFAFQYLPQVTRALML